jgi:formylglycine-generating enzyme required for sulfatase activity
MEYNLKIKKNLSNKFLVCFFINVFIFFTFYLFPVQSGEDKTKNDLIYNELLELSNKIEKGYNRVNEKLMPSKIHSQMRVLGSNSEGYNEFHYIPDGSVMIFIPEGDFVMGSNAGLKNCIPERKVFLNSFYIDKFEVSNGLLRKLFIKSGLKKDNFNPGLPLEPAVNYSIGLIEKLFSNIGKKFPTEAQWEKAARGADKRIYPWGNDSPGSNDLWKANLMAAGRMEKAGNVWEWCRDSYEEKAYSILSDKNPVYIDLINVNNLLIVMRGGAFSHPEQFCRTYTRSYSSYRLVSGGTVGFRLVIEP